MREKQESGSVPVPAEFMSAQSAIVGLRGKDLLTTVRSLAVHGLRQPLHSARHLVAFGGQLGKVLLGDTLHQPNPQDARFQDPSWRLNPFYRRTLQAYLAWQKQLLAWIDESNLDCDDRARARFLVALLGHLQVRRQLRKVSSVTYLVSLLDSQMESPAMLFADEQTLESSKRRSYQHGVLDGRDMAKVFAWMRPNDLIWNYWVNNYLLGRQPPAFDILYWNNDNTRLPAAFHGELLDLFKHNPLTRPGALEVSGTAVDLGKVAIDSFHVAGITDHITPWDAVYRSALLLGGQRRFILSNSGHIQSILNPPGNPKACYFENDKLSSDPRAWYYDAKREEGSWWPVWLGWLQERSGELGDPDFNLGSATHPPLEAAPGTYVHIR